MISEKTNPVPPLIIDGVQVERVNEYRYLGTVIDSKLDFNTNTLTIHKKCQSRIYCLQKLRNLRVNEKVLAGFYRCFIESVLTFSFMCWFGGLSVKNKNVLNRVVNVCSKIVGVQQRGLKELYECRVLRKGGAIACDESHVLAKHYDLLPSGKRFRLPRLKTVRLKQSFIPSSIQLLNR